MKRSSISTTTATRAAAGVGSAFVLAVLSAGPAMADPPQEVRGASSEHGGGAAAQSNGAGEAKGGPPEEKPTAQSAPPEETKSDGDDADVTATPSSDGTSVTVTSTKDLSNVVLRFCDGTEQRFEGLSGGSGTFAGTGGNAGKVIDVVFVKSGSNDSGAGPGYGEAVDVATSCTTSAGGGGSSGG